MAAADFSKLTFSYPGPARAVIVGHPRTPSPHKPPPAVDVLLRIHSIVCFRKKTLRLLLSALYLLYRLTPLFCKHRVISYGHYGWVGLATGLVLPLATVTQAVDGQGM